jgi:hypothetical protein
MKKDALKQQEQTASFQRLSALLKRVKPSLKNEHDWTVLENSLFATLLETRPFREKHQESVLF